MKKSLNFYLSSVTVKDFNYQPTKKTKRNLEVFKRCKFNQIRGYYR